MFPDFPYLVSYDLCERRDLPTIRQVEDTGGTPFLGLNACAGVKSCLRGGGGGADWGPEDKIMDKLILMA